MEVDCSQTSNILDGHTACPSEQLGYKLGDLQGLVTSLFFVVLVQLPLVLCFPGVLQSDHIVQYWSQMSLNGATWSVRTWALLSQSSSLQIGQRPHDCGINMLIMDYCTASGSESFRQELQKALMIWLTILPWQCQFVHFDSSWV